MSGQGENHMERLRQMAERHFGQTQFAVQDAAAQGIAERRLDRMSLGELLYFVLFEDGCSGMTASPGGC